MIRPCDMMAVLMARLLRDGETVFHGVSSHLPLVSVLLARRLHAPNLLHLNIAGGVNPRPGRLSRATSAGSELWESADASLSLSEVFDLSMRGQLDVAFLSGVQIDRRGGVNASLIGDWQQPRVLLPGGAGSAVLVPTARRAILWRSKHDRRTFVESVDFLTARGNVSDVVTPLCHFRMDHGELLLESVHPGHDVEEVAQQTAFPIRYRTLRRTTPPSEQEMAALNEVDPQDLRNIEFLPT